MPPSTDRPANQTNICMIQSCQAVFQASTSRPLGVPTKNFVPVVGSMREGWLPGVHFLVAFEILVHPIFVACIVPGDEQAKCSRGGLSLPPLAVPGLTIEPHLLKALVNSQLEDPGPFPGAHPVGAEVHEVPYDPVRRSWRTCWRSWRRTCWRSWRTCWSRRPRRAGVHLGISMRQLVGHHVSMDRATGGLHG